MAFKEYDNNIYTKESNDRIDNYLKSIIQRYFQIENEISQETKEAIIIQAYTRLKEILNAYTNEYMICINERSGAIDFCIRDFGGEEAFDKNTAFNKDFCSDTSETKTLWDGTIEIYNHFGNEEADKIVMGDDDRLSDAREPLEHVHTIDDIIGLRDILEHYNLINGGFHVHANYNVLQMIEYTGSRVSIDLILLEDLAAKVEKTVERLTETDEYFINIAKRYLNQMHDIFEPVYKRLEYIKTKLDEWIDWLNEAKLYTDIQNVAYRNNIETFLKQYLSLEEYEILKNVLEKSIMMVDEGLINLSSEPFKFDSINNYLESTETSYFCGDPFVVKIGYTNIKLSKTTSKKITDSNVLKHFKDNNINNGMYKLFLEYTKDGINYCDKLPHLYQVNDSVHDSILVYGETDSNNNINVVAKRITELPIYIYHPIYFNAYAEDNAGNIGNHSILTIENNDTTEIDNGNVQEYNNPKSTDSTNGSFNIRKFQVDENKHLFDLQAVNAPYSNSLKELLFFTSLEDYTGPFKITMNTGHWYGFHVYESTDGVNFTEIASNDKDSNAMHDKLGKNVPLTLELSVTFHKDHIYKIATRECDGGGTEADKFFYDFTADKNLSIGIGSMHDDIPNAVTFTANSDGNNCTLSWTVEDTATYAYHYKVLKYANYSLIDTIDCGSNMSKVTAVIDAYAPRKPKITGKCIANDNTMEQYEFTIDASDIYEENQYKLQVYDSDDNLKFESDIISVSSYSDIKKIYYTVGLNQESDLTATNTFQVISEEDISSVQKKVVLQYNKVPGLDDRLYFFDNNMHHMGTNEDIENFLSPFNCNLAKGTENVDFLQSIMLLHNQLEGDLYYHVQDKKNFYRDGTLLNQEDNEIWFYIGEYKYKTIGSFLSNAKCRYKLFRVPGKGEENA